MEKPVLAKTPQATPSPCLLDLGLWATYLPDMFTIPSLGVCGMKCSHLSV